MADENEKSGLARRIQLRSADRSMSRATASNKRQQKDYVAIMVEHLRDNGQLICISDDRGFLETLREIVTGTLKMPASCLYVSSRADMVAKLSRQAVERGKAPLVLIEQQLNGRDLTFVVRVLKNAFPELKIMMLVREADRSRFVLLHESGVDACIVRPLDGDTLLEKMALTIRPNEQVERSLEWARTLLEKGEYLQALQNCTQALEKQSGSASILIMMGDIFKAMKEYEKSADAYRKACGSSGLYLEPLNKLAELYAERGDTAKQIEYLEKMDELSPLNLDRKIRIGELSLKLHQPDKAKKAFDQAMKLTKRQAGENVSCVAYRVADLYMEADPLMAASFLQRGLDARREFWSQEDIATFNRLGLILRRSGKWREAADEYLKAITVSPNDENLHYNLAMAYLEGKELEQARASTLKAMALNPDLPKKSSRIAANLAAVFMSTNDKMHALPLLRQALEQDPENEQAKELMAKVDNADAQEGRQGS